MRRFSNALLVACFLVAIWLPLGINIAGIDGADAEAENRTLAEWPALDGSLALKLGGAKPFAAIEMGRVREFARRADRDPDRAAELAASTIERIAEAWTALRREIAVPEAYLAPLRRHWGAVPVLAPHAALIA